MSGQVWVSLISLGGVVLGGMLSHLVRHRTQLSAERAEQQRQRNALSEARRAERLALLERFIEVAAEAERSAFSRPSEFDDTHPWYLKTQDVDQSYSRTPFCPGPVRIRRVGRELRVARLIRDQDRERPGMQESARRHHGIRQQPCPGMPDHSRTIGADMDLETQPDKHFRISAVPSRNSEVSHDAGIAPVSAHRGAHPSA